MFNMLKKVEPSIVDNYFIALVQNPNSFNENYFKDNILPKFNSVINAKTFFGFTEDQYKNNLKLRAFENVSGTATDLFIAFVNFHNNSEWNKKEKKIDYVYQEILNIVKKELPHNNGELILKYKKINEKVSLNFPLFIYDLEGTCLKNKNLITEQEILMLMELELKHSYSYFIEDLPIDNQHIQKVAKRYNERNNDGSMLNQYINSKSRQLNTLSHLNAYYSNLSKEEFSQQLSHINNFTLLGYIFQTEKNQRNNAMFRKNFYLSKKILNSMDNNKIVTYFKKEKVVTALLDWSNKESEDFILKKIKEINKPLVISKDNVLNYLDKLIQKDTTKLMNFFIEEIVIQNDKKEIIESIRTLKRYQKNEALKVQIEKLTLENMITEPQPTDVSKNKLKL
jgi:hypothetical protein